MKELEQRSYAMKELRAVAGDDGGPTKLMGYAAVFDQLSLPLGGYLEKIQRGAFADTIQNDDIRALYNHNSENILGRKKAKTLRLIEDEHGLKIECDVPDTQVGRDLLVSVKRGDIDGMSFGFWVMNSDDERWETDEKTGVSTRTLLRVKIDEVSFVTFPAYPQTEVEARSRILENAIREKRIDQPGTPGGEAGAGSNGAQGRRFANRKRKLKLLELQ